MNILVTGASGKLGTVLVERLKLSGHQVTGIDLMPGSTTDHILDIENKDEVLKITADMDAVIHTAAIHGKHLDLNFTREAFINTNIYGTLNLLNACVKNKVNKFLYTSTTSIYGNAMVNPNQAVWVDELLVEQPRDIYDITKQAAEQLCKDFFYKERLQTSVYRVGRFLPESDNLKINHRLYRGLDERDAAEALLLAIDHDFTDFQIFNITSGSPFTRDDLVQLKSDPLKVILKYYPDAARQYQLKGWKFPESIDRVYVTDKARIHLGYTPKYTFEYLLTTLMAQ